MSTWMPAEARVSDALRRLADARAVAERAGAAHAAAALLPMLEALGRAIAYGAAASSLPAWLDADTALPGAVRAALSSDAFELGALEDAGVAIAGAAADDDAVADASESSALALKAGFEARDRIEHVLLGAQRLLGAASAPMLTRVQQIYLVEFEHLVRPRLARLTAWNEVRGETAAALAPELRARFWWWCEGSSIAPSASGNLAAVAELVARFPEARSQLDALVAASRALSVTSAASPAAARATPGALPRVTRLSAWLDERRRQRSGRAQARGAPDAELRVAAASHEERIVLASHSHYEVSWRTPSSVIVDLHVDPREGTTPHARLPSGRVVPSRLVERTVHRYAIALDAGALAEGSLVVVMPLSGGDSEIPIPPDDR